MNYRFRATQELRAWTIGIEPCARLHGADRTERKERRAISSRRSRRACGLGVHSNPFKRWCVALDVFVSRMHSCQVHAFPCRSPRISVEKERDDPSSRYRYLSFTPTPGLPSNRTRIDPQSKRNPPRFHSPFRSRVMHTSPAEDNLTISLSSAGCVQNGRRGCRDRWCRARQIGVWSAESARQVPSRTLLRAHELTRGHVSATRDHAHQAGDRGRCVRRKGATGRAGSCSADAWCGRAGFKSYKEQVATEPFSPKTNVIGASDERTDVRTMRFQRMETTQGGSVRKNTCLTHTHAVDERLRTLQWVPMVRARPTSSKVRRTNDANDEQIARRRETTADVCRRNEAIRFVLSDLYTNLRVEDRQQLLHVSGASR